MNPAKDDRDATAGSSDLPRRARDYRAMDLHRLIEYTTADAMTGRHRIAQELAPPESTDVALDVGCAYGEWVNGYLAGRTASVVGVDIDREDVGRAADFARRMLSTKARPAFGVTSAHDLPFTDEAFTLVYLMDVLEHVDRPERTAAEVRRILAPGGRLVVSVPGDWLLNWLDPHYPEHRHYSPEQLKSFFPGLEILTVHQTGFLWATIWGKYIRFLFTRATRLIPGRKRRAAVLRRTSNAISHIADLDCRLNYGFGVALCIVFRKPHS
jgi:SAM-dependent methyltransferase